MTVQLFFLSRSNVFLYSVVFALILKTFFPFRFLTLCTKWLLDADLFFVSKSMFVKSFKVHWTLSLHKSETNFLFDLFSYYKNFFDCRTVRFFFESLFQKAIWILDGLFFFFSFFFFISSKFLYLLFDDLNLFLNQRRIFFFGKVGFFSFVWRIFYTKNLFVFSFFGRKNLVLVSLLAAFSTLHNKGVFAYNNIPFWYVSCGRCKIETSTAMVDFWHLFWSMHLVLLVTKVLVLFRFFVDNDFCCFWKSDSFPTFCNWYLLPFLFFCCWCYFDYFLTLHSCFSGFPLLV